MRSSPRVALRISMAQRCRDGRWRIPIFCSASSIAALQRTAAGTHNRTDMLQVGLRSLGKRTPVLGCSGQD